MNAREVKLLSGNILKEKIFLSLKESFSKSQILLKKQKMVTLDFTNSLENLKYNQSINNIAEKLAISCKNFNFSKINSFKTAKKILEDFNQNPNVQGILINQPLPEKFKKLTHFLNRKKDLEGTHPKNLVKLLLGSAKIIPCTPMAVMEFIDYYKIPLEGKKVCILGRSLIVGKSIFLLLLHRNASISICHSYTKIEDLKNYTKSADIIITCVGKANFLKKDMIEKGSIILDVGTNYVNNKLYGDVDFHSVYEKVDAITPVPGGIGLLTSLMLFKNFLRLIHS